MERNILQDNSSPLRHPRPRPSTAKWNAEEDAVLWQAVKDNSGKRWNQVAANLPGRTSVQCMHRWQKVLRPGLVKGPWSREEDAQLRDIMQRLISQKRSIKWSFIAQQLNGRFGKQCRERWYNHLSPDIKRGEWTEEEDRLIIENHAKFGNSWTAIGRSLEGRTSAAIKRRWNATLKHTVEKDTIDSQDDDRKSENDSDEISAPVQDERLTIKCSNLESTRSSERQSDVNDVEAANLLRALSSSTHDTSGQWPCNDSSFEQWPVQREVDQTARKALMTSVHNIVLAKLAERNRMTFENGSPSIPHDETEPSNRVTRPPPCASFGRFNAHGIKQPTSHFFARYPRQRAADLASLSNLPPPPFTAPFTAQIPTASPRYHNMLCSNIFQP